MTWTATADVERFDEAVDHFLKRTIMPADQARQLDASARASAFWVGGGMQMSAVQDVFGQIEKALESGEPFEEWKARVGESFKLNSHAETVFRNATQQAYNFGRWHQMTDPAVLKFRPYGMVDAILDDATTAYCRELDGTIVALEDPWWDTHYFPAHHRCRTSVRSMRKAEAERRGVANPKPDLSPVPGFGASPRAAAQWKPDKSKFDPGLHKAFLAKKPKLKSVPAAPPDRKSVV